MTCWVVFVDGAESMVMKIHGNVRGKVRVNSLALLVSKHHIFICGSLTFLRIVRANVRRNIAIPSNFFLVPEFAHFPEVEKLLRICPAWPA